MVVMKTSTRCHVTAMSQVDEQSLRTFENRVRQVLMSSGARAASVESRPNHLPPSLLETIPGRRRATHDDGRATLS